MQHMGARRPSSQQPPSDAVLAAGCALGCGALVASAPLAAMSAASLYPGIVIVLALCAATAAIGAGQIRTVPRSRALLTAGAAVVAALATLAGYSVRSANAHERAAVDARIAARVQAEDARAREAA